MPASKAAGRAKGYDAGHAPALSVNLSKFGILVLFLFFKIPVIGNFIIYLFIKIFIY